MKKTKIILLRSFFYLIAFQILNISIDIDYLSNASGNINFDDIDSFTEYLVEKITNDNHYTSEDDDDSSSPFNTGIEKYNNNNPFCSEEFAKPNLYFLMQQTISWTASLDMANRTCKGYFSIISLPPET
jgi:hypothetical protein